MATSPHIGRRVSVHGNVEQFVKGGRKARIIGGSRAKGFLVQFEDDGGKRTCGPTDYSYITCDVCGKSRCVCDGQHPVAVALSAIFGA